MLNLLITISEPVKYILIGAAIVIVLIIVFAILRKIFSRKKKTEAQKTIDDRSLVAYNSESVGALIARAQGNDELVADLSALKEELKYLIASDDKKVQECDQKIKNELEDLKITLNKKGDDAKIENRIKDIRVLIAERKSKL